MRLECPMHGKAQLREGQQIAYRDGNFAGRIGWHEVTVVGDRLAVIRSSGRRAPGTALDANRNFQHSDPEIGCGVSGRHHPMRSSFVSAHSTVDRHSTIWLGRCWMTDGCP